MNFIAKEVLAGCGRVDVIIANAGVNVHPGDDLSELEAARLNMETNYFGVLNTILPFVEIQALPTASRIAVVSSISSLRATHNSGTYSASKAAISIWTESLRLRLLEEKISVTNLIVGFIDTSMNSGNSFSMPGLMSPEKAAQKIMAAISRRKSVYGFPWQSASIFRIFSLLPTWLYTRLVDVKKRRSTR